MMAIRLIRKPKPKIISSLSSINHPSARCARIHRQSSRVRGRFGHSCVHC
jgi:hypothetical protein